MLPWSAPLAGRFEEHELDSRVLRGNPLGDPHRRPLWVYVPPGYDAAPSRRYPSVYAIQGLTGQLDMWRNRSPFRPTYLELVDAMFARHESPPGLVVFVDCWTSLGGSQFLDSPGTGRYHTYLCDEVVPFVDAHYRTLPAAAHRGIQGKSSGGYGAMVTPMLRPDLFGGMASHAGDALFEVSYAPDVRDAVRALRDEHGGSYDRFWKDFRSRPAMTKKVRRRPPQPLLHGRLLLDRRRRHRAPPLRPRHRPHRRRGLAALARLGPRPHGPEITPRRSLR